MSPAAGNNANDAAVDQSSVGTEVGKPLDGVWTFKTPVEAKSVNRIQIQFHREHRDGVHDAWEYHWEWRRKANSDVSPITPSAESVNAAKAAAEKDLKDLKAPDKIVPSEASYIATNDVVRHDFDGSIKANTAAVVGLSQDVESPGDAVVFAASGDMNLPITEKSITGADLPKVETKADVLDRCRVWKTFDDGTRADLLALYGESLFDISTVGIKLNATIVVIDNDVKDITDAKVNKFGLSGDIATDPPPSSLPYGIFEIELE